MIVFFKRFLALQRNQVIVAIAAALLVGFYGNAPLLETADVISTIYTRLLKFISLPIIFLSITATLTSLPGYVDVKQLGARVMGYTVATTFIAAFVALVLFVIFRPALGGEGIPDILPATAQLDYKNFLINIIPANVVDVFLQNNVIGVMLVAFALGLSTFHIAPEQRVFLGQLFGSLFQAMIKVTGFVLRFIPLAIWGFFTVFIHDHADGMSVKSVGLYFTLVLAANLIQALIVLPLFLRSKGIPVLRLVRGYLPALSVAFFTKSSTAALATTIQCAQENLGVSKRVSNFALPLCITCNMNACAAFILLTTLFVAASHGVVFTPLSLIGWACLATLAALGNAGVPMGCFFLTTAFLSALDVPLSIMGLILPLYTMLDMVETAVNVWSDGVITAMVEKDIDPQWTALQEV